MPFSEMATLLDVSEGTIRNRVGAMKNAGVLQITAITDASIKEYSSEAMIGINVAPSVDPERIAQRLSQLDDVIYVVWVSGRYDLLIEVISETTATFVEFLSTHLHNQEDIASIEVMTGLKNFKNQFLLKQNWS